MVKRFGIIILLWGVLWGGIARGADWAGYADATAAKLPVFAAGFEQGEHIAPEMSCYRVDPKGGTNGGGALALTRTEPGDYRFQPIPLPPLDGNRVYRLTLEVYTPELEGVEPGGPMEFAGVEFYRDGQYVSGSYFAEPVSRDGFSEHVKEFVPPPDTQAVLTLYLDRRATGVIRFDEVKVECVGENYTSVLSWPAELAIRPGDADFRFEVDSRAPDGLAALVSLRQGDRTEEEWFPVSAAHQVTGSWPEELEPGACEVEITLADRAARKILGRDRYRLNVLADAALPADACLIDRYGRAMVGGKPFMPIGVYAVPMREADLKRVADAGFNCVMNYELLWGWGRDNGIDRLLANLDLLQRHGLKAIVSLKDQLPGSNPDWCASEWNGVQGALPVAAAIVAAAKDHPALLAWYISDEAIRMDVPEVLALREAVSTADPNHPTWTLTCHYNDLPYYGVSGDVVGVDPYPIDHKKGDDQHIGEIVTAMKAANSTGLPVWLVPQMFNWGRHKEALWDEAAWRRSRAPNAEELRAMPLLGAICGAKGFVFFAYLDWVSAVEGFAPGAGEQAWADMVPAAAALKELEPFILSLAAAPAVTVEGDAAHDVYARAFADDLGRLRVVIAGTGAPVKAVIRVADDRELHSRYGKTRSLGGGRYEFTASAVESDVLFDQP